MTTIHMLPPNPRWLRQMFLTNRTMAAQLQEVFRNRLAMIYHDKQLNTPIDPVRRAELLDWIARQQKGLGHMPEPQWIAKERSKVDQGKLRNRCWMRIAALYATPEGSVRQLSLALGLHHQTLPNTAAPANSMPLAVKNAIKIEEFLGADIMPVRLTRPDLYV